MKTITTNGDIFLPPTIKSDLYSVEIAVYSEICFGFLIELLSLMMEYRAFLMKYRSLLRDYMTLLTKYTVAADWGPFLVFDMRVI